MAKEVKVISITLPIEQVEQVKAISKEILGKEGISVLVSYWINKYNKEKEGAK